MPPGNDTPCTPPHSIQLAGVCQPSCGSEHGTTCGVPQCKGQTPLPAYDCDICCVAPVLDASVASDAGVANDAGLAKDAAVHAAAVTKDASSGTGSDAAVRDAS